MKTNIQMYFQTQGDNPRLLTLAKDVDFFVCPDMHITISEEIQNTVLKVYFIDGTYYAWLSKAVQPPNNEWESNLKNLQEKGWKIISEN